MGDLSRYFSRSEFACKCGCGFQTVDVDLIDVLKMVRSKFEVSVTITSACRCLEYNEKTQREANKNYLPYSSESKHMEGIAADIVVKGIDQGYVYAYLDAAFPMSHGIGKYKSFTHIDVRQNKSRWKG